jgi:hypothetical protein
MSRFQMGRPSTNDLFALFPDLPWTRRRSGKQRLEEVHAQVERTRERARANILRQRAAAERVRAALALRRLS